MLKDDTIYYDTLTGMLVYDYEVSESFDDNIDEDHEPVELEDGNTMLYSLSLNQTSPDIRQDMFIEWLAGTALRLCPRSINVDIEDTLEWESCILKPETLKEFNDFWKEKRV